MSMPPAGRSWILWKRTRNRYDVQGWHTMSCMQIYDFIGGETVTRPRPPCLEAADRQRPIAAFLHPDAAARDLLERQLLALMALPAHHHA